MNQLTIFDFIENGQQANSAILDKIQGAFPGWEALGYAKEFVWDWGEDYSAIIRRGDQYECVRVELYRDGRVSAGYTRRRDFVTRWFERDEEKGRHWVWRSLEDRERVFGVARQNKG